MRKILIAFTVLVTLSWADVSMSSTQKSDKDSHRPEDPIVRPKKKPDRPFRPVPTYFYSSVITNCDQYLQIIEKRDAEIKALKEELYRLRSIEQAQLRKELKEEYEREMKKFNERDSGRNIQDTINISKQRSE